MPHRYLIISTKKRIYNYILQVVLLVFFSFISFLFRKRAKQLSGFDTFLVKKFLKKCLRERTSHIWCTLVPFRKVGCKNCFTFSVLLIKHLIWNHLKKKGYILVTVSGDRVHHSNNSTIAGTAAQSHPGGSSLVSYAQVCTPDRQEKRISMG